ncbi:hypothetical protein IGB42_02967 [Andreprevotia sp. IGB-42]|uniref:YybH family protein n=1 Tax=Andreprevotia sp. IGB-42 TaxID=2497473 RepID=UPI00135C7591|nr:SgcJ/EcaC family oxidoreductase [Andreprevotia sp. IGB-42]KAF0812675.1 hypothetical protein IGB42_02967 [Andreprevotia sp. IGB-42]
MTTQTDPLLQVLDAYAAAVLTKDVAAFAALYDADVHLFDMWGSWSMQGIAAWRDMASGWFASLGDERVVVSSQQAQSTQLGDLAIGHAILTFTAIAADGSKLRSLDNRLTVALRRNDDGWKIIHEHTSAPIEHASMKAVLQYPAGG